MKLSKLFSLVSIVCCLSAASTFAADHSDAVAKFDKPPVPVLTPPPSAPDALKGTAGMVSCMVIINADGSVAEVIVTKSTSAEFEAPSVAAISRWKFKPAEVNGQPVKAKISIPIRFS